MAGAVPMASACALCGLPADRGLPAGKVFGPGFSAYPDIERPDETHVCEPCAWALAGKPPNTLRLWSIVYRPDRPADPSNPKAKLDLGPHVQLTTRGDLRAAMALLLDPPEGVEWVVTIAVSGQKHVVPFARTNTGRRWTIRFEATDLAATSDELARCLHHAVELKRLGFSSEEITSGQPHIARLSKHMDAWRRHSGALAFFRAGHLLELALMALTKEHTDEIGDLADTAYAARARAA